MDYNFTVLLHIYYSGYLTSQQRNKHNTFDNLSGADNGHWLQCEWYWGLRPPPRRLRPLDLGALGAITSYPSNTNSWLWDYTLWLRTPCQKILAMSLHDCK